MVSAAVFYAQVRLAGVVHIYGSHGSEILDYVASIRWIRRASEGMIEERKRGSEVSCSTEGAG